LQLNLVEKEIGSFVKSTHGDVSRIPRCENLYASGLGFQSPTIILNLKSAIEKFMQMLKKRLFESHFLEVI